MKFPIWSKSGNVWVRKNRNFLKFALMLWNSFFGLHKNLCKRKDYNYNNQNIYVDVSIIAEGSRARRTRWRRDGFGSETTEILILVSERVVAASQATAEQSSALSPLPNIKFTIHYITFTMYSRETRNFKYRGEVFTKSDCHLGLWFYWT